MRVNYNKNKKVILGSALLSFLVACAAWQPGEEFTHAPAVWSDDEQALGLVYEYFEFQETTTHRKMRNISSEVYVMSTDGIYNSNQLTLDKNKATKVLPQQTGDMSDLFYMRSQGYLVAGFQERLSTDLDANGNRDLTATYYLARDDGSSHEILGKRTGPDMLSCGGTGSVSVPSPLVFVPSPDGTVIAMVEHEVTCDQIKATLTFLDPQNQLPLSEPIEVNQDWEWDMPSRNYAWSNSGRFMILYQSPLGGYTGDSFAPDGSMEMVLTAEYHCIRDQTKSSQFNAAGHGIYVESGLDIVKLKTKPVKNRYSGCE